jgi:precorrin-8X/cobalt-precorrin-8 methylmutase
MRAKDEAAMDYLRDPEEIVRRSFAAIRRETDLSGVPDDLTTVALRVVHACAMPDIVAELAWSPGAGAAGRAALQSGAPLLVDTEMLRHGITTARLPAHNRVICTIDDPVTAALAQRRGTTRSAAALELWRPYLEAAVVAIGNAPTALFHLLEMLSAGAPRPALIVAMPPGFIGAAEAKEALIEAPFDVPYLTLRGRRGGTACAAAAINALARAEPSPTTDGGRAP